MELVGFDTGSPKSPHLPQTKLKSHHNRRTAMATSWFLSMSTKTIETCSTPARIKKESLIPEKGVSEVFDVGDSCTYIDYIHRLIQMI